MSPSGNATDDQRLHSDSIRALADGSSTISGIGSTIRRHRCVSRQEFIGGTRSTERDATATHDRDDRQRPRSRRDHCRGIIPYTTPSSPTRRIDERQRTVRHAMTPGRPYHGVTRGLMYHGVIRGLTRRAANARRTHRRWSSDAPFVAPAFGPNYSRAETMHATTPHTPPRQ